MLLKLEKFVLLKFATDALGPEVAIFSCDEI